MGKSLAHDIVNRVALYQLGYTDKEIHFIEG